MGMRDEEPSTSEGRWGHREGSGGPARAVAYFFLRGWQKMWGGGRVIGCDRWQGGGERETSKYTDSVTAVTNTIVFNDVFVQRKQGRNF